MLSVRQGRFSRILKDCGAARDRGRESLASASIHRKNLLSPKTPVPLTSRPSCVRSNVVATRGPACLPQKPARGPRAATRKQPCSRSIRRLGRWTPQVNSTSGGRESLGGSANARGKSGTPMTLGPRKRRPCGAENVPAAPRQQATAVAPFVPRTVDLRSMLAELV